MNKRKEIKEKEETLVERAVEYEKTRQKCKIIDLVFLSIIIIGAFICGMFIIPNISYETILWIIVPVILIWCIILLFFAIREIDS